MMYAFALAAAVATNPTILRSVSAPAPRFVRLRLDVIAAANVDAAQQREIAVHA